MTTDHYLPLFVGDFTASTQLWDFDEQNLYLRLLMLQWTTGPLPNDVRRLGRALRIEQARFDQLWRTVSSKFVLTDSNMLINERLESVRERNAEIFATRQRVSAAGNAKRWGKAIPSGQLKHPVGTPDGIPSDPIRSDPIRTEPLGRLTPDPLRKAQLAATVTTLVRKKRIKTT